MPTNTYTYAFGGTPPGTGGSPGTTGIQGYGDRWQILFSGSWLNDEKWGLDLISTAGDYSVGSNNFFAQSITSLVLKFCTTFKNRVYLAAGGQFNFSDNGDPTGWEQQNPGAGFVTYLSYFGGIDTVNAISELQGRLVVIARRSVQLWTVDADPANFALVQEMDNIGSRAPLSAQNIGDFDVIILDDTGFRSLRTREVTLNAYVDDIGVSIDSLVQADLLSVSAATCCAIVEPTTKNYWAYLNGKIYVLSRYPSSKVSAWTLFLPTYEAYSTINAATANYVASLNSATVVTDSVYKWTPGAHEVSLVNGTETLTAAGYFKAQGTNITLNGTGATVSYTGVLQLVTVTTFIPTKFVVFNGQVYVLCNDRTLLLYGGSNNNTYDGCVATVVLPWLDDKQPALMKIAQGIDVALEGNWSLSVSPDPATNTPVAVWTVPSPTGSELSDSSFDLLRIGYSQKGTHFLVKLVTDPTWAQSATISELLFHYNRADRK